MKRIVDFKNVTFNYLESETPAVKNVNFAIGQGEVVFLTGKSGSGKSTLLNLLNGIIPEVIEGELKGDITIKGESHMKTYERNLILGNVFQNPRGQFFTTNTTAEMVFAMENYGIEKNEIERRLSEIIRKYKVEKLMDRNIFNISSGERQFLALLSVLIMNPQVIIFDEPSANLDYGNAMRLRKQIIKLKEEGKTVLVADHRCFYLKGIIDRVLLIENKGVKTFDSEKDFMNSDFGKRSFELFNENYAVKDRDITRYKNPEENVLILKDVGYKNILKDVNIKVKRGEVTTLVGVNGVGKTTLASIISNVTKQDKGEVITDEKVLYIMQDADYQLFGASVLGELRITQKDDEKNEKALKNLNLWKLKDKHPQSLSGGEKQRLQMAIAQVGNEGIIILDEPTSGLDKDSMERLANIIDGLKKNRGIIIISHDYEFIRKTGDKVIYLKEGTIDNEFYMNDEGIEKLNNIFKEMESYYE